MKQITSIKVLLSSVCRNVYSTSAYKFNTSLSLYVIRLSAFRKAMATKYYKIKFIKLSAWMREIGRTPQLQAVRVSAFETALR